MEVKDFLLINGAVLILLVFYMMLARSRPKKPSMINHRKGEPVDDAQPPAQSPATVSKPTAAEVNRKASSERSLNAHFLHDGQSFDAYEVLNVPAGCSFAMAEEAFRGIVAKATGPNEVELLKKALGSIKAINP